MNENLLFWWSVISTVLNVGLLLASVWLLSAEKERAKRKNSQVKIWQQDANGLSAALQRMISDVHNGLYTTTQDMANTLWALQALAFSLYQSLFEERAITEDEYKQQQKELVEEYKKSRQPLIPEEESTKKK
ncbi:MAG: hypothetical protein M1355_04310 [Patescibacteria group bacterium]|nr:hypothetical protein [Patescibacteria group bacterium]